MTDPFDLERFVTAQQGTFGRAIGELREGRKRGHWMWFVFPQFAGLGPSATAQHYAIRGLDEARAYFEHPTLGPRLVEAARALIALGSTDLVEVLGPVDAMKLRSSMTLFGRAAAEEPVFQQVLDQYFGGEEDQETLRRI